MEKEMLDERNSDVRHGRVSSFCGGYACTSRPTAVELWGLKMNSNKNIRIVLSHHCCMEVPRNRHLELLHQFLRHWNLVKPLEVCFSVSNRFFHFYVKHDLLHRVGVNVKRIAGSWCIRKKRKNCTLNSVQPMKSGSKRVSTKVDSSRFCFRFRRHISFRDIAPPFPLSSLPP